MTVEQLLYQHDGVTYGTLVESSMLEKFRNDEATAASAVDVYEVFRFASGKQGTMLRPSNTELGLAFGTEDLDKVIAFILDNGSFDKHVRKSGGKAKKHSQKHDDSLAANSRMHVEHTRLL